MAAGQAASVWIADRTGDLLVREALLSGLRCVDGWLVVNSVRADDAVLFGDSVEESDSIWNGDSVRVVGFLLWQTTIEGSVWTGISMAGEKEVNKEIGFFGLCGV